MSNVAGLFYAADVAHPQG